MSTDNATRPSPASAEEPDSETVRTERRRQLAQRIGRLLADTWLQRQRAQTRPTDSAEESRQNQVP